MRPEDRSDGVPDPLPKRVCLDVNFARERIELSNGVLGGVVKSSLSVSYIVVGGVMADEYVYEDDVLGRAGRALALSKWACGTDGVEKWPSTLDLHLQVGASEAVPRAESESGGILVGGRFSVDRLEALLCL